MTQEEARPNYRKSLGGTSLYLCAPILFESWFEGFLLCFYTLGPVWYMCLKTENCCLKIFIEIRVGEKVYRIT